MDLNDIITGAVENALIKTGAYISKKGDFDLIDIDGVCDLTGYSKHTIWKMTSRHEIPFIKRPGGRKLFFSKKAVEKWLLSEK